MATSYRTVEIKGDSKRIQDLIKAGKAYFPWRVWGGVELADREDRDQYRQDVADVEAFLSRRESFYASALPVRFATMMARKPAELVEDPEPRDLPRLQGLTMIGWWPPGMAPARRRDDPDPDEFGEPPEMLDVMPGQIVKAIVERKPSVNQIAATMAHVVADGRIRLHTEAEWLERGRFLGACRNPSYWSVVARMAVFEELGLEPVAAERAKLEDRPDLLMRQMPRAEEEWARAVATRRKRK